MSIRTELSAAYHKLFGGDSSLISFNPQPPKAAAVKKPAKTNSPASAPSSKSEDCPALFTVSPMPLTGTQEADQYIASYNAQVAQALSAKNEDRTEKRENMTREYYYHSTVTENTAAKRVVKISDNSDYAAKSSTLSLEPSGNLVSESSSDQYPWRGIGLMFGSSDASTETFTRNPDGSLREEYSSFHEAGAYDSSYSMKHTTIIFPDGHVVQRENSVKGY